MFCLCVYGTCIYSSHWLVNTDSVFEDRKTRGQECKNPMSSVRELFYQNGLVPDRTFGKKIPISDLTMSPGNKKKCLHHFKYVFKLETYIKNKEIYRGGKWSRRSVSSLVSITPPLLTTLYHEVLSPKVETKKRKKKECANIYVKGEEVENVTLVCPDSFFST